MSEMIERVAKALRDSHGRTGHSFEDDARAAMEAMRSPTPQMLDSGAEAHAGRGYVTATSIDYLWEAMIDAALSDA